jgi:ribosome-associated translation inhibitor RaiA
MTDSASRRTQTELEQLAERYRHLREERRRAGQDGRVRRGLERRLAAAAEQFERRLRQAALDEEQRRAWMAHLHHGEPPPPQAGRAAPLVFRGRSASGSELLVFALPSGELELRADGVTVERLARADELLSSSPELDFPAAGQLFRESFVLADGALEALEELLAQGRPVPGQEALLAEGLVGRNLELTPRGRRALARLANDHPHRFLERGPLEIVSRGSVGRSAREQLASALERLAAQAPRPVISMRGTLSHEQGVARPRAARAEATLELRGRAVRAIAEAATLPEAIDLLVERLQRALRDLRQAAQAERRESGVAEPGSWRHGSLASHPPGHSAGRAG